MRSFFVVGLLGVLVLAGCKGDADTDVAPGDGSVTITGDDAAVPQLNWTPPPVAIAVDGDACRVAAAIAHLAQHVGEQLAESWIELGGAQVQPDDPAHAVFPFVFGGQNAVRYCSSSHGLTAL